MRDLHLELNASTDRLTINAVHHVVGRTVYLHDSSGKVVLQEPLESHGVNVESLTEGSYTVVIHYDKCLTLTGGFRKQ